MIRTCRHSEAGGHADNEDAFDLQQHAEDEQAWLCVVADGQGGRAGGAAAARTACRSCMEACSARPPSKLLRPRTWRDIFRTTDEAVAGDSEAGFTTLAALCIKGGRLCGVSNGDSAVVLANGGEPPVTLTSRQPKNPPVGCGGAACSVFQEDLVSPWRLLLMSDGVWKYAGWGAVVSAAANEAGQVCIDTLRKAATLPGSGGLQDDFTLIVLEG